MRSQVASHTGSTVSFPLWFPNGVAIPLHIKSSVDSTQNLLTSVDVNVEITAIGIIAVDSQFIIFHVWDIFIYKVLDKLIDFKSGELYDMLLLLQSRKKSCWSVLTVKNNFGIHHSKHHPVITKKERRSDLIAEISASIKKIHKYKFQINFEIRNRMRIYSTIFHR